MYPNKPCYLLTCNSKGCLWTKKQVQELRESVRNWPRPLFPPQKVNHIK